MVEIMLISSFMYNRTFYLNWHPLKILKPWELFVMIKVTFIFYHNALSVCFKCNINIQIRFI